MAIKINNKDLYRRVINQKDVQKVIANGYQIRPESRPVDYHIISNRGTGGSGGSGVPGGWSIGGGGGGGSAVIGENGVSNGWESGATQGKAELKYDGLPSLINAKRIVIDYSFYWNPIRVSTPFETYFMEENTRTCTAKIDEYRSSQWSAKISADLWHSSPLLVFGDLSAGEYTATVEIDLESEMSSNKAVISILDWGTTAGLNDNLIANIRRSTDFWIVLNDGIRLERVDFYVYNTPQS